MLISYCFIWIFSNSLITSYFYQQAPSKNEGALKNLSLNLIYGIITHIRDLELSFTQMGRTSRNLILSNTPYSQTVRTHSPNTYICSLSESDFLTVKYQLRPILTSFGLDEAGWASLAKSYTAPHMTVSMVISLIRIPSKHCIYLWMYGSGQPYSWHEANSHYICGLSQCSSKQSEPC
jgi:hypothetical protein